MLNRRSIPLICVALLTVTALASEAHAGQSVSGQLKSKKKKYLKNTVVYIEKMPGTFSGAGKTAQMDQKNQTFIPFVLPVVKGTSIDFLNNDNTGHNVFSPDGKKYDLGTWKQGEKRSHAFAEEGVYTQLCKMHPSMLAYVVVLQNPYFAVTGDDGRFEIKDVPPGKYRLAVWNERRQAKTVPISVNGSPLSDVSLELER